MKDYAKREEKKEGGTEKEVGGAAREKTRDHYTT